MREAKINMKIETTAEINEVELTHYGRATVMYKKSGGGIRNHDDFHGWCGGYADISASDASLLRVGDKVRVTIEVVDEKERS
jgi:PII-like signaling protein